MPTHICLRRNYQLFLPLTPWSYPKCRNILHTLNVYEIAAKEHQVVDLWAADEISVLERLFLKYLEYVTLILRNYKKMDKHFHIYKFIFFKCRIHLSDNSRIIFRKTKKCPLNIRFLYKFLYKVQNMSPNITLLQKTNENVTNSKSNVFLIASNQ